MRVIVAERCHRRARWSAITPWAVCGLTVLVSSTITTRALAERHAARALMGEEDPARAFSRLAELETANDALTKRVERRERQLRRVANLLRALSGARLELSAEDLGPLFDQELEGQWAAIQRCAEEGEGPWEAQHLITDVQSLMAPSSSLYAELSRWEQRFGWLLEVAHALETELSIASGKGGLPSFGVRQEPHDLRSALEEVTEQRQLNDALSEELQRREVQLRGLATAVHFMTLPPRPGTATLELIFDLELEAQARRGSGEFDARHLHALTHVGRSIPELAAASARWSERLGQGLEGTDRFLEARLRFDEECVGPECDVAREDPWGCIVRWWAASRASLRAAPQ